MEVRIAHLNNIGAELGSETIRVDHESSDGIAAAVRRLASNSVVCTGDTITITEV